MKSALLYFHLSVVWVLTNRGQYEFDDKYHQKVSLCCSILSWIRYKRGIYRNVMQVYMKVNTIFTKIYQEDKRLCDFIISFPTQLGHFFFLDYAYD